MRHITVGPLLGNPPVTVHKGPVMRKAFTCHGFIIERIRGLDELMPQHYVLVCATLLVEPHYSTCYGAAWQVTLQWRHNGRDGVSNHEPRDCLLNRVYRRRSKKTSKLRITGLCAWNSPVTGESRTQMTSNEENVSIWWRHHESVLHWCYYTPSTYS